MRTVGAVRIEQ